MRRYRVLDLVAHPEQQTGAYLAVDKQNAISVEELVKVVEDQGQQLQGLTGLVDALLGFVETWVKADSRHHEKIAAVAKETAVVFERAGKSLGDRARFLATKGGTVQ